MTAVIDLGTSLGGRMLAWTIAGVIAVVVVGAFYIAETRIRDHHKAALRKLREGGPS